VLLLASACRQNNNHTESSKNVSKCEAGDVDSRLADHFDTGGTSFCDAALLE
jgi:hypothetical protein